jgi:CRISPR-associated endonuclease/helicase Cas3
VSRYFAHSLPNRPIEEWEPLDDHLKAVSELAGKFADGFGAADWGRVLGLWHDLGKYSAAFQAFLLQANAIDAHMEQQPGRVDHSTAGAQHATAAMEPWGRLLAYPIAGHHAGLCDSAGGISSLANRLVKTIEAFDAAPASLIQVESLPQPGLSIDTKDEARASFQLSLFVRMLFSCLVDADFLATESFMNPEQAKHRPRARRQIDNMAIALAQHLARLAAGGADNEVGRRRQQVLAACRAAVDQPPGLFTLTVPTGGGKTLASLAFALAHSQHHALDRVIYAIPFTSIIEQTADVFRNVFARLGDNVVLEHHSNVDPDDPKRETRLSRLATENWDAPLVVSTNVQLFESLFAARTSQCRKLHNLAGSVIILDEAQTIPVELLQPCLAVLRELVADYHCSIILCTATQPALSRRNGFLIGFENVREIIPDPGSLYQAMKRVEVQQIGALTDQQIVDRMMIEESFLCIVNTRPHAAKLFGQLRARTEDTAGLFHLSTHLCGQHRAELLAKIRQRLCAGKLCRVVSTQLIEAGVDVDFPVVYRALSGLDSIAQAAGRCNREGILSKGAVYVFDPVDVRLQGYLASVASSAAEVAPDFADLLDPAAVTRYFELHYWKHADRWDKRDVMRCFPKPAQNFAFDFRTASERFRMIDDAGKSVFVPYDLKSARLIEQLRQEGPSRWLLRRLQRYTVSVYEPIYRQMLGNDIEELPGEYAVLINPDIYDKHLGLRVDRIGYHEPETLIC